MKIIHSIISLLLPAAALAQVATTPLPSTYDYAPVTTHFNSCLDGQIETNYSPSTFETDYVFPLSDVADVKNRVWNEWKNVNAAFVSAKKEQQPRASLYALGILQANYMIPVALEPYVRESLDPNKFKDVVGNDGEHTFMLYKFGYKGNNAKPLPLLIFLHGSGTPADEWKNAETVSKSSDDSPSLYFIPRIPNGSGNYYRWYHKSKQWVWEKLFRQMLVRNDIDHNRFYFLGISEGAYGSQRLGSFYADYLAGIGPMAGGEPLTNCPPENLRNIYFNLTTGELDSNYGRDWLTKYVDQYLNKLQVDDPENYVHDVTIVPLAEHGDIAYHKTSPELVKHYRTACPKHVRWENYPMDGRYRDGFYNLRVYSRSDSGDSDTDRGYYTMDIDDNTVNMTVSVVKTTVHNTWDGYGASIPLNISKSYTPATHGKFKIYLNSDLVDLSREVTVKVNDKELFKGLLQPNLADMVNSCAEYYDPARVFPASVTVDLASMTATALTQDNSAIDSIQADNDSQAPVEYYNLQGIRVDNPASPGIYIRRQGTKTTKVIL